MSAIEQRQLRQRRDEGSRVRAILGIGVSVIALLGVVWWASRQETPTFPTGATNIAIMLLALGAYALAMLGRGWRWDHILRYLTVRHSSADAYGLTCVGYMGNTVLPARGGELLRIFLLADRSHALRREVLGSIITERLLDVSALAGLFVVLAAAAVGGTPGGALVAVLAGVGLIAGVGGLYGYLLLRRRGCFARFADRVRPVARASRVLLTPRGSLLGAVACAIWLGDGLVLWLGGQALDVSLTAGDALFVIVFAGLSALIPAGPGMVGTYDAAALFALHHVGVHGGAAVSTLLLFRFVAFVPITLIGLALMVFRYGGLRAALRGEAQAAAT
jgi:glycosyltransferase 2 family protein